MLFCDKDNTFSGGDLSVGGVRIELYTDPNGDGDPSDGVLVGAVATATNGSYLFGGLVDGDYVVVETDANGAASVTGRLSRVPHTYFAYRAALSEVPLAAITTWLTSFPDSSLRASEVAEPFSRSTASSTAGCS